MDDPSFESAARHWQRRIYTFATYLLADPPTAEEVTQDVLLKLWRHPHLLADPGLERWLLTVTRNACIDHQRLGNRRRRWLEPAGGVPQIDLVAATQPDPEHESAAHQLGDRLARALLSLPELQRSVVLLREVFGLPYRDIAAAVGLSLASVKITLHRARRRLRQRLGEEARHELAV